MKKLIFTLGFLSIILPRLGFSQGGVYPLSSDVCVTTANYTLTWSGTGSIDHWERNDGSGWSTIANTNAAVTFPTPTAGTYTYRTYVNQGGGVMVYSVMATVNVYALSTADGSVNLTFDAATRCASDNAGTVVLGAGYTGTLTNWAYSYTGSAPWVDVNQNTTTLTYSNLPQTTYYKAVVKNGACPAVLSTNSATITVTPNPSGGTASLSSSEICQGNTSLLSVTGNSGSTFTWQKDNAGLWTDLAVGATYTTPVLANGTYNYRLKADLTCKDNANLVVTKTANSNTVQLLVDQTTAVANPNGATVVSANDATVNSITVVPTNGSVVRWEYSLDNAQWTPVTSTSSTYNYSNLTSSTWYRAVIKNGACAEVASTTPVKVTVANGGTITGTETNFCSPSAAATLTATGIDGTSYAWEYSVSPYTVWNVSSANVATLGINNLTQTTKYRINVNGGKAYSGLFTATVSPATVAGTLSTVNATICANDATTRTINLAGNTGNAVRWEYSHTNNDPWSVIENTTSSLTFSALAQTTYYRAIVQNGACAEAATPSLVINVATGGAVGTDISVCESDATVRSLSLSGHNGTVNYWEKSEYNTGSSSWGAYTNIGNAGSTTINFTNLTKSTRYRAVITSTCASPLTSDFATVTVYSASVAGTLSGSKTIRSGNNSGNITLTGNNGNVIRWESSATGTAPWTSIANTTTTLAYTNVGTTTYYRAIVQNGPCAEAISTNTALLTVATGGYISDDIAICASDATVRTLTVNNYVGTISGWEKSTNGGNSWTGIAGTNGNTTLNYSNLTQTTLYRVVITEDAGSTYSTPATVTVNPLPTPLYAVTSDCDLKGIVFTNTSTIASGSILYTDWTFGDGTGETASNPTHTYPSAGTYSAKLTLTSDKLCKNSVTHTVTVYPLPIVDFTFTNVCDQKTLELTNNSNLPAYTLTYGWNLGDGSTSTLSDPTHKYATHGQYDITLTATSNVGCIKTLTKTATIFENPIARFVSDSVCHNNVTSFTNNSTIGNGNLTYTWTFNDANATSTLEHPTHTFTKDSSYTIKLVATSPNACKDSITHLAVIHPNPVANYTTADNCFAKVSNFTNTTTIKAGALTYAWDFKDGSSSIALNPAHTYATAGQYVVKLTATSDYGCINTKEKVLTVNPNPTVNFAAASVCNGNATNFLNYSTLNATNVTYNWNFDDAQTATTKEPTHTYATSGNYNVKLKVTSAVGCVDSLTNIITVYPNPVAAFTTSDKCFGVTASFANTSAVSSGAITEYLWDLGNGKTSTLQTPTHDYAIAGAYNVQLTATSNNGCTGTVSHPINILAKPVPSFTQADVCSADSMVFVNTSTNLVATPTYSWNFGDASGTSTQANPKYPYTNAGTYNVALTVTNGNNCSASVTQSVKVNPRTVVNFSFVNPCEGTATQFHNSSTLSSGAATYLWNFGGGITSTNPEPYNTYAVYGSHPITLKATTDKGCVDSLQKVVTVYQNPIVDFTVPNVCNNDSSRFTNATTAANSTLTYAWTFGDQLTSTNTNPVHRYATPGTYNTVLVATSNHGCVGQKSKNAQVNPNPFANFNYTPVCVNAATTFENVSTIEAGTMTYLWNLGNTQTSTSTSPTVTYNTAGSKTISVVVTSNNGCIDTATRTFTVYPAPVASFTVDTVCDGLSNTFTNTSNIVSGSINYIQWDFGDATNSLQANPVHKFASAGSHAVSLLAVSDNGCRATVTKNAIVDYIPVPNFSANAVCKGNIMEFHDLTYYSPSAGGTLSYSWNMGDANTYTVKEPQHLYTNAGIYTVTFIATSNIGNCTANIVKQVVVNALPNVNAGLDTTMSKGWDYTMAATATQGTYQWSPSEGLSSAYLLNPIATPQVTTTYVLQVTDINGCISRDTMKLKINKDYELIKLQNSVSNILTPDGNGENDTWFIKNISFYKENHVYIYNRWGELVYEKVAYDNTWAATNKYGDSLPDGEYYYVITFDGSDVVLKGAITVLRNLNK